MARLVATKSMGVEYTIKLTEEEYHLIGSLLKLLSMRTWNEVKADRVELSNTFNVWDGIAAPTALATNEFGAVVLQDNKDRL